MIPYSVYKVIHLIGILMVFLAVGGVTMHVINGGGREHSWRKAIGITHGFGLILALVGGFGLLARLGVAQGPMPGWAMAKIGIWLIFAIMVGIVIRKKSWAKSLWVITLCLGGVATYLAGSKPF